MDPRVVAGGHPRVVPLLKRSIERLDGVDVCHQLGSPGDRRMAIIVPEIGARLPRCCSPSPVGYEKALKKYSTRTIVMVIPRIAARIDMVRAGTIVRRCPSWCFTCLAMP